MEHTVVGVKLLDAVFLVSRKHRVCVCLLGCLSACLFLRLSVCLGLFLFVCVFALSFG